MPVIDTLDVRNRAQPFRLYVSSLRRWPGIKLLAKTGGTSGDIIGKYDLDEVKPSIEVAS